MPDLKVGEIKSLLQGLCPGLLHDLVPNMRREGSVWSAPNPTRGGDTHGSFKLWNNGAWKEFDDDETTNKGDVLGLLAYVAGLAPKSREGRKYAIGEAKKLLGLDSKSPEQLRVVRRDLAHDAQRRKEQSEKEEADRVRKAMAHASAMWREARCFDDPDNLAARYLLGRGIDMFKVANPVASIRLHFDLDHWALPHGRLWRGPAMVVGMVNADGFAGVQCTWLARPGEPHDGKGRPPLDVMPNRKLTRGVKKGAVVPLANGASGHTVRDAIANGARGPVILAEGTESGLPLAIAVPEARVWACLDLGNIAHAPIDLKCVNAVFVALENDVKPQALAQRERVLETLGDRCAKLGIPLETLAPHQGNDFADLMGEQV